MMLPRCNMQMVTIARRSSRTINAHTDTKLQQETYGQHFFQSHKLHQDTPKSPWILCPAVTDLSSLGGGKHWHTVTCLDLPLRPVVWSLVRMSPPRELCGRFLCLFQNWTPFFVYAPAWLHHLGSPNYNSLTISVSVSPKSQEPTTWPEAEAQAGSTTRLDVRTDENVLFPTVLYCDSEPLPKFKLYSVHELGTSAVVCECFSKLVKMLIECLVCVFVYCNAFNDLIRHPGHCTLLQW